MGRVKRLLEAMRAEPFTPGDVASSTGMPKCEVLAALRVLEELGIVESAAQGGARDSYRLTRLGEKLYRALELVESLELGVEPGGGVSQSRQEALAAESGG